MLTCLQLSSCDGAISKGGFRVAVEGHGECHLTGPLHGHVRSASGAWVHAAG